MISLDTKNIKLLQARLDVLDKKGFPKATRDTLNITVANARKTARRLIQENMVIKGAKNSNPALRGVQFDQTQSLIVKDQKAVIGHTSPFWPLQEFGGTVFAKGKDGLPIPTGAAANQRGVAIRTRQVAARNRLSRIKLGRSTVRAKNRKQRNAVLIAQAKKRGAKKDVFLDLGAKKGIFRVGKDKITMMYDVSEKSARLRPRPAIFPAATRQAKFIPEVYERQLTKQFKRSQRRAR